VLGAVACEGYDEGRDSATLEDEQNRPYGAEPEAGGMADLGGGDVDWIAGVKVGSQLEDGTVSDDTSEFEPDQPIIVSVELDNPPMGQAVRLEVYDRNEKQVWSEEQTLGQMQQAPGQMQPGGAEPQADSEQAINFRIRDGALPQGEYTAYVVVDDQRVEEKQFEVNGAETGAAT
jgi:hypothetical protein